MEWTGSVGVNRRVVTAQFCGLLSRAPLRTKPRRHLDSQRLAWIIFLSLLARQLLLQTASDRVLSQVLGALGTQR